MKFLKVFFAIIISFIFIIVLSGGLFLGGLTKFATKENIENVVNDLGTKEFLREFSNNEIIDVISEIPEIQKLLAEKSGQAVEYILYQEELPQLTKEDIDLLMNSSYFNDWSASEKIELNTYIEEFAEAFNEELKADLDQININDFAQDDSLDLKLIFSIKTKIVIGIILFALTGLMCLSLWSFHRPLAWIGTSAIISGISIFVLSKILGTELIREVNRNDFFGKLLYESMFENLTLMSFVALGIGVILITVYLVIKGKISSTESKKIDEALS